MKGSSFEREIARLLSLWWSDNQRTDIFYRSHASGGRFTMRRKSGQDTALQGGDITASDPIGEPLVREWSIEIKTGYGKKTDSGISRWDSLDALDSSQKVTVFEKMWNQCVRDADLTNRNPVLIFRRNGRKPCIAIRKEYELSLTNFFGEAPHPYIEYNKIKIRPLHSFFEWITNIRPALSHSSKKTIKRKRI